MNIEEFLIWESARRDAYKGLAECYKLPEKDLTFVLKELKRSFEILGSDALFQIIMLCIENQEQFDIQTLKVEYTRLFIGPYNLLAPPYGSVYLEGKRKIMEDSTMDIQRRYAEAGLTTSESFKEIPDHIRAELEFMHFLVFKGMGATNNGDATDFNSSLHNQYSFLEKHLCAWISDFTDNVIKNSQISYYQNLARATEAFVKDDYHTVSSMLNAWPVAFEARVDLESLPTPC